MAESLPVERPAAGRFVAFALVGAAVLRACVSIVPQVRFDVDPASDPSGYAGIGPTASFALDIVVLAASVAAIVLELGAGRRIVRWLMVAAALPALAVLAHGSAETRDLFRGSTWVAAAFAAVAALHLARDPGLRRILVAGSLAVALPLAFRGFEQVLFEHRQTVAFFDANKASILAERGWAAGSPAAEGFERRLRQVEATAWLGLSNLFSTVMVFAAIGFGALAWLGRAVAGRAVLCGLVALACATLLVLNGSKGAFGATVLGLAVAVVGLRFGRRAGGWAALVCVLLAASAPAVRSMLPETALGGERSLLFRGHYLAGAIGAAGEAWPLGVGPDGFQEVFLRVKPDRAPEDVTSTHAAWLDWLVLLGPLGVAWIALVVRLLLGWPGQKPSGAEGSGDDCASGRTLMVGGAILALSIFALLAIAEESIADPRWLLGRGGAALAFGVGFVLAGRALSAVSAARWEPWLFGAITAVIAQAQIEMTLYQPGLPIWVMLALGAIAGPARVGNALAVAPRAIDAVPIALPAAMALALLSFGLLPQWSQDHQLDRAAELVRPLAAVRDAWSGGLSAEVARGEAGPRTTDVLALVRSVGGVELEAMLRSGLAAGTTPQERITGARRALERFDGGQRAKTADLLRSADEANPANPVALEASIRQLAAAGRRTLGPRRAEIVDPVLHTAALERAMQYAERWGTARSHAMLADLWLERARATTDAATLTAAEAAVRAAIERQPRAWGRRVDLGDVLAARGALDEAVEAYRAGLAIDDALELDPLVQMTPSVRATVVRRIELAQAAINGGDQPPPGWPLRSPAVN